MIKDPDKKLVPEIKNLKDDELVAAAIKLSVHERALCVQLLHHLMIIEDRRLYAKRGYGSLYDFVIQELKYSQGAAYRRIQAMRLMRGVPEVKEKIEAGTLSLTNAAQVQKFMRAESKITKKNYKKSEKLELVKTIEGKSTRECEKTLRDISPGVLPTEKERVLSAQETEIRFIADKVLMAKFNELKQLLSHVHPNPSYQELFHLLADRALTQVQKQKRLKLGRKTRGGMKVVGKSTQTPAPRSVRVSRQRYIGAQLKREVYRRDRGECSYEDSKTGRKCQSKFQLEYDHIKPVALGGVSQWENLRLLCREHNALMAEVNLGVKRGTHNGAEKNN